MTVLKHPEAKWLQDMAELAELCSPRVLKFLNASGSNLAGMTTPGSLLARSQPESCHHPTREGAWEQAICSSRLKIKLGTHMIWHDDINSIENFNPKHHPKRYL